MLRMSSAAMITYEKGNSSAAQEKHKESLNEVARFLSEGKNFIVFVETDTGVQVRSCCYQKDHPKFIPILKHFVNHLENLE